MASCAYGKPPTTLTASPVYGTDVYRCDAARGNRPSSALRFELGAVSSIGSISEGSLLLTFPTRVLTRYTVLELTPCPTVETQVMATVERVLTEIAREAADATETRLILLEQEARQLRAQLEAAGAESSAVRLAVSRLSSFSAKAGEDYLCPRCYITDGTRSPQLSIRCTRDEEFFRCDQGHEIAVAYG